MSAFVWLNHVYRTYWVRLSVWSRTVRNIQALYQTLQNIVLCASIGRPNKIFFCNSAQYEAIPYYVEETFQCYDILASILESSLKFPRFECLMSDWRNSIWISNNNCQFKWRHASGSILLLYVGTRQKL